MASKRTWFCVLLLAASADLAVAQATSDPASEVAPNGASERYARVTRKGVRLLNVPDGNGRTLIELEQGAIVRLHGERSGWTKAEIPNGFPAWIHGRYAKATELADVVEITRNGVNVRARPSSDSNNFPVGQLYAGDRVRTLATPPELAQEAAEWVHISSPPGFWAWLRNEDVADLGAGVDGDALWQESQGLLVAKATTASGTTAKRAGDAQPAASDSGPTNALARALERANAVFERETAKTGDAQPDFRAVRAAYDSVLQLSPDPSVRQLVEERLERVGVLESAVALRLELESQKMTEGTRREQEARELQERIAEEARRKDPFRYRYDERGLLERRTVGDDVRYFLRWGGRDVCELHCSSGRYDLALFLGMDVGIRGRTLLVPASDSASEGEAPRAIDVARIEILARG